MANRVTKSVFFTPEQAEFVTHCLESGRYQSASEVVRAALRLLEDAERARNASVARDRESVEQGLADLDRGDAVPGPRFFAKWKAKHRRAKVRKVAKKR